MTMNKQLLVAAFLLPSFSSLAQEAPKAAAKEVKRIGYSGSITPGAQLTNNPKSSKFNEYRDFKDGVYLPGLGLEVFDNETGRFIEIRGSNIFRSDQNLSAEIGKYGRYRLEFEWDKLTHLLSNKAKTPYEYQGRGVYMVPSTVTGITKKLNTAAGDATMMSNTNDPLVEAYLSRTLKSTDLQNSRNMRVVGFEYSLMDDLNFRVNYSNESRDGNKVTYGPIGDRPPRSLNIQFQEPLDYKTQEFKFEVDYLLADKVQLNASYMLSDFKNNVDNLTWQNIYNSAGSSFETWTSGEAVGTFGMRALPPDNKHHVASLNFGVDLPLDSRLGGNVSYGWMRQNETLIPYSTLEVTDTIDSKAWTDKTKLPRATADAKINTQLYELNYTISPIDRLNLRASARFFNLDNQTPEDSWKYVTQDTVNATTGRPEYTNNRKSVAYAYDQKNYALDATYGLDFWRTTFSAGAELEKINRKHREGNTKEGIYRFSLRSRPLKWVSFRTKYQYRNRGIDHYDTHGSADTYTYDANQATTSASNFNDPKYTFENHPDMRVFDLTDRKRHQVDLSASVTPIKKLDVMGSFKWKKDDFNSNVAATTPLVNYAGNGTVTAADRAALTPGFQLGLLNAKQQQYGLDAGYPVTDRLILNAFASWDHSETQQREMEFQENNKGNPSVIASTVNLGPWTDPKMLWTANIKDRTQTIGFGANYTVIPETLRVGTTQTFSRGTIDIEFGGFGALSRVNPVTGLADNNEYAFTSPSAVHHLRYTANFNVDYQLIKDMSIGLGYLFERYSVADWQQQGEKGAEPVNGNENLLRDNSRSQQWGNRLPNMGQLLAPSYVAHMGTVTLTYRF